MISSDQPSRPREEPPGRWRPAWRFWIGVLSSLVVVAFFYLAFQRP